MKRRAFLTNTGLAVLGSMTFPNFLKGIKLGDELDDRRALVVIQLGGGNDGLNMIVPFANDIYYRERPTLSLGKAEVLKLNDDSGLNAQMAALLPFYHNGEMLIINDVGYPEPDRSHFRSMDIWQSGSASNERINTGWLGRFADQVEGPLVKHHLLELNDKLSLAVKGKTYKALAFQNANNFYHTTREPFFTDAATMHQHQHDHHKVSYLYHTLADAQLSAAAIKEKLNFQHSSFIYPKEPLANQLKHVAELIQANIGTKAYYVGMSGFDTHVQQKGIQNKRLKSLAESLAVFISDLKRNKNFDNTLVMVFSEFGRRVKENAAGGTDHGTANNVLLLGGQLKKKGMLNDINNLSDLDEGDLKYKVDFRNIYGTILDRWLDTPASNVLSGGINYLNFI